MFNPYVIIGVIIAFIVTGGGAFYEGGAYQRTKDKADQEAAIQKAVDSAKQDAEVDYGVQQQLALEQQKHELLKQTSRQKVAKAVAADPASTSCRMGDATFSVLKSSIDASNSGSTASTGDSPVPASDATGRPITGGSELRTGLNRVDPIDVQTDSPATR